MSAFDDLPDEELPTTGHNSSAFEDQEDNVFGVSQEEALLGYVHRIEELEEDKKDIATIITDTYKRAKDEGYDVKVLKEVVKRRKMDKGDREEMDALIGTYEAKLGM